MLESSSSSLRDIDGEVDFFRELFSHDQEISKHIAKRYSRAALLGPESMKLRSEGEDREDD